MFWMQDNADERLPQTKPAHLTRPSPPDASNPRWTHTCAWDGHELGDIDYVQPSPHERVCRFHHPQFQTWIEDLSKRKYRFDEPDEEG